MQDVKNRTTIINMILSYFFWNKWLNLPTKTPNKELAKLYLRKESNLNCQLSQLSHVINKKTF